MILAASRGEVKSGANILATPVAWRSCRCRRVVNSTLARETQAALSATDEVEWAQTMIRDVLQGDVVDQKWQEQLGDFVSVQPQDCQAFSRLPHQHVVDAKSLYDTLSKDAAVERTRGPPSTSASSETLSLGRDRGCAGFRII